MANSKHLNQVFSNEKQRAILIDRSPNREEASRSLKIMHNMSRDETRVPLHLEAKLSNTKNVNNSTPDYLMDGDRFCGSSKKGKNIK